MEKTRNIVIVGCGPGSAEYVSPMARNAIADASLLIGSRRLLELFGECHCEKVTVNADIEKALDKIAEKRESGKIAVLVSGDPGLCSLAKPVVRRFGRENCKIIPGVSSLQLAFASVGLDWLDAKIITAHASEPEVDIDAIAEEPKIAVLGGNQKSMEWIFKLAKRLSGDRKIFLCENLSLPEEKIEQVTLKEFHNCRPSSMTIVLLIKEELLLS